MPELKYVVSGDDSQIQKMFNDVAKKSKETAVAIKRDFDKVQQKQVKLEVNYGDRSTIASGTVVGEHAKRGAAANAAFAQSTQKVTAAVQQQGTVTATTTALQNTQSKTIDQLRIKLASYQAVVNSTTDTKRIALYNAKIEQTQARVTQLSNAGKTGFDKFGNAVGKNTSAIGGMFSSLKGLASLIPGVGLAGIAAMAIGPLIDYISKIDFLGTKLKEISAISFTSSEYKAALKDTAELAVNIQSAKDGVISKTDALDHYNETIGKTQGKLKTFNQLEVWQEKNVGNYLKMVQMKAEAQAFLAVAIEKATEAARRQVTGATWQDYALAAGNQLGRGQFSVKGIKNDANTAVMMSAAGTKKESEEALKIFQQKTREAQVFAQKTGLSFFDQDEPKKLQVKADAMLAIQKSLQKEIDAIHRNALKKQLTDDEQEIQSVKDKYDAIQRKIIEFYADPRNKGSKYNVDQSRLVADETAEIEAILKRRAAKEEKIEKERFQSLLKEFETFEEKKIRILSDANTAADELIKNGYDDQAKVALDRAYKEIASLDEANIKKLASYKDLFENIEELTKKQTLDGIAKLKAEVAAYKGSATAKEAILKEVEKLEKKVLNPKSSIKDINEILRSLRDVSTEFSNLNGTIGSITSSLLGSAKAYIEIKEGMKVVNDEEASGPQKAAAGIGIVGAALGVINSIVGYFRGLKKAKEEARKALAEFQNTAVKGEQEYQALLRKRDQDSVARGKNTYRAIVAQLELLKAQSPKIQEAYEKVYAALQGQSMVTGVGYKHGTWLRKAKTWDIMASLAGTDYANLEKLYTEGKLKDQAKSDFESLRALREELEAAGLSMESLQTQLNELLTGTSTGGLADGFAQLFENGKFAAQDFGDSFEEIMRKAITNSFRLKVMEDAMQPFYDEFASLFVNGTPTEAEIDDLKKKYEAIGLKLGDQFKELEKITGRSLTTPADSSPAFNSKNSLQGAITGISQQSAELIAGQFGGFRIAQLETLAQIKLQTGYNAQCVNLSIQKVNLAVKIEQHTFRTANNTDRLGAMETALKSIDTKMDNNANALKAGGFKP